MGSPRLNWRILLPYAAPALPLAILGLPLNVHLPAFWAEAMGLPLATVGLVLTLVRLLDVVFDPAIGRISDRWHTRIGRRRPPILLAIPVGVLGGAALFFPPQGAGAVWLFCAYAALTLGWSLIALPWQAWGAELPDDYGERTRITSLRETGTLLGIVLSAVLPAALALSDPAATLHVLALLCLALSLPALLALLCLVPERPRVAATQPDLREALRTAWANLAFRRLLAAWAVNGIANGLPAVLFLLLCRHVLRDSAASGPLLLIYFVAGILGVPFWTWMSGRIGKHRAWCAAMLWTCAAFLPVLALGPGDTIGFGLICIATGAAAGDAGRCHRPRHARAWRAARRPVLRRLDHGAEGRQRAVRGHRLRSAGSGGLLRRGRKHRPAPHDPGAAVLRASRSSQTRRNLPGMEVSDRRGGADAHTHGAGRPHMTPPSIPEGVGLRVVGDVHGDARAFAAAMHTDRFVIQLGDLVDYGPDSAGTLRIAFDMMESGRGLFVLGNHDLKLSRALAGRDVRMDGTLAATLAQLDPDLRARAQEMFSRTPAWLVQRHRLFVHGGFHTAMLEEDPPPPPEGRVVGVLSRALYGEPTGRTQPDGYPERSLRWVDRIPPGLTVYCGHDRRSTDGRPYIRTGAQGGVAVFLDTGAGKGGHLSWIDLPPE